MTEDEKKEVIQISSIIENLIKVKFYGTLELKFENGIIQFVRKSETIKLNR